MPRPPRTSFPDGLYHITAHATGSENLFRDDLDHDAFRTLLSTIAKRHGWRVHARCTMGNHYHLLIDTPREHMSDGMHALQHTYAKRFNKRYRRSGCLFKGRYSSTWIRDEDHYGPPSSTSGRTPSRTASASRPRTGPGRRSNRSR